MHRNVTAIYRTHATADLVRRELSEFGIKSGDIHLIPERDTPVGADGDRDDQRYSDKLHDLHLPDEDLKTYQQSVRHGDYVVSAEVDEDKVAQVKKIMSRPEEEAHDLDRRSGEFADTGVAAYSDPANRSIPEDQRARRDPDHTDPYTRSYTRDARLDERR